MALAQEDAACLDTLSDAPDAVLLARAQGGDDDAFAEVVQRYETRLRSYLTRLLNDADLAADVLQETLLDLYRNWGTRTVPQPPPDGAPPRDPGFRSTRSVPQPPPDGGKAPGTRSNWGTRAVPQPPPDGGKAPGTPDRAALPANLPGWLYRAATNNAIDALRRRSFRARLVGLLTTATPAPRDPAADATERLAAARALARLSPADRTCILLSAALGLRYQEVARVLEIGEAAARQRITRAKARFRRLYEEEG